MIGVYFIMGSAHKETDEILQDHIKHMGEKLGRYFNALWNEVAYLYTKWSEYDELFGKPSRVDLLNDAAPTFFYIVQDCLRMDILLHVARLTDRCDTFGNKNLSVRGFPDLISSGTLKKEIERLIDSAIQKADFCKDWRDRRLAHKDLKLSISDEAKPLKPVSRKKVKDVLEAISSIMNAIAGHYMDTTIIFDGLTRLKGAEALLYIIDDRIKADKRWRERIRTRKYNKDD